MRNLLLALIIISSATVQAQNKIGYINSAELLTLMPEVKAADSVIQVLRSELQKQYNSYLAEYQTKVNEYNSGAESWSEVKREAAEEDINTLQKRITNFESSSQQKIETRRQELLEPILDKANAAIEKIGKEKKLTCIMDTSAGSVIYIGEDMVDILPLAKTELNLN